MILKKLSIENIRSYEKQEIAFPKGSTLLSGDIGAGKTTVLLAIEFALFGLQPSQKASSILRNGAENAKVSLEFEIDGKEIIIERSLKKNKTISQDYASITVDNERFEGSVTEIKSKILKLLNYPSEFAKKTNLLYKFTVYTPQEEMKQIIQESKELRLNTLRHVFGIDKYKRIEENACKITSKLREKVRINQGIIYDLDENKKELEEKKQNLVSLIGKQKQAGEDYNKSVELRADREKAVEEVEEKINEKKALETEKGKSEILISEKTQQITTHENNINSLRLQIQEAKEISFNQEEFNVLDDRIKFQENKAEELQKDYIQTISQANSQEARKKDSDELKTKISSMQKCPTCLQGVSEEYKKNYTEILKLFLFTGINTPDPGEIFATIDIPDELIEYITELDLKFDKNIIVSDHVWKRI